MARKFCIGLLVCLSALIASRMAWADELRVSQSQRNALRELDAVSEEKPKVRWNDKGVPSFLTGKFRVEAEGKTKPERAVIFLNRQKSLFRIKDANQEFKPKKSGKDYLNFEHVRLQQQYNGVPVYGGELIIHFNREDKISAVNGNYLPDISISTTPKLTSAEALNIAENDVAPGFIPGKVNGGQPDSIRRQAPALQADPQVKLEIYPFQRKYFLVRHPRLRVHTPKPAIWEYFIDAQTGKILFKYNSLKSDGPVSGSGTGVLGDTKEFSTYYQNGTYYLSNTTKSMYTNGGICSSRGVINVYKYKDEFSLTSCPTTLSSDNDNNWENTVAGSCGNWGADHQGAEADAYYYAGVTYDYYKNIHNRNSWDDNGASIRAVAHYNGCYNNAHWDSVNEVLEFGDGDGSTFKPLSGALDIVAHEFTHAVIDSTGNLEYNGQSGALNESYADFFGTMVEHFEYLGDWQIGENVYLGTDRSALRDMSDPHMGATFDSNNPLSSKWQPANMNEYLQLYSSDNGGVHINNGIPNYAAYLIATNVDTYIETTQRIYYLTLTQYLTPTSTFADIREATLLACNELYSKDLVYDRYVTAVQSAFDTVGISSKHSPEDYNVSWVSSQFIGGGTAQNWKSNEGKWKYKLPFSFPFYGNDNITSLYVSANGFLSFAPYSQGDFYNDEQRFNSWRMIAPLWMDLVTSGSAQTNEDIYISTTSRSVCIRWRGETHSGMHPVNVEVVLYKDGRIRFDYGSGNTNLNTGLFSPLIGISSGDTANYLYTTSTNLKYAKSIFFYPSNIQLNCYRDADGDGYGNSSISTKVNGCLCSSGYVEDNTDCDDNDAEIHPGIVWYKDADGDGYSSGITSNGCWQKADAHAAHYYLADELITTGGDCNDNDARIHPGTVWYKDADGDGFGSSQKNTKLVGCYSNLYSQNEAHYYLADQLISTNGDKNDNNACVHPAHIVYVPDDYSTIQSAIDKAVCRDTILVAEGVYQENLVFTKKALIVESAAYGTIIDGSAQPTEPAVTFDTSDSIYTTVLNGFIIRNGAGGIKVDSRITTSPLLILNNIIYSNYRNKGAGIYCNNSSPIIMNNTIVTNTAVYSGGGIYAVNGSSPRVINTIIWNNISSTNSRIASSQIYIDPSSSITVTYSNIQSGYTGNGNINSNPHFKDAAGRNYHLQKDSPCIDMGISKYKGVSPQDDIDLDPRPIFAGYDMGADESREITVTRTVSTGSNRRVVLSNSTVNSSNAPVVVFDNVSAGGQIIFSAIKSANQPASIPAMDFELSDKSGYYILSTYYSIRTQELSYTGKPKVAFHYDDTGLTQAQEENLHLLHYNNSAYLWQDITTSISISSNIIHGEVEGGFSPFVIIVPYSPSSSSNNDISSKNTSDKGKNPACFIATAAYGTPFAREVQVLRNFRDAYLLTDDMGQGFVSFYYKYSPPIADFIRDNSFLRAVVRTILRPVVWLVQNLCPQCAPSQENTSVQQSQAEK